jgi:predicted membrane channel-forming protein YqfA (hemolysin III family)
MGGDHGVAQGALLPAEVPALYKINDHVVFGYKEFRLSSRECVRSIWHTNNETVNVWTSFLIMLNCSVWTAVALHKPDTTPYFRAIVALCTVCRCLCWGFSAIAHAFSTHISTDIVALVWRLDHVGIYFSIMGFCNAGSYIEFEPVFPSRLWKLCTVVGTTGCVMSILFILQKGDAFYFEENRVLRTVPFAVSIAVYCIPYAYKLAVFGFSPYSPWFCASIVAPFVGGAFFVSLWPESAVRSRFVHTWCLSHHFWHWSNVCADVCFYTAIYMAATPSADLISGGSYFYLYV